MIDKNCLSYWFPKLADADIECPRTKIIRAEKEAIESIHRFLDGEVEDKPCESLLRLVEQIKEAALPFGKPFFLRTGQGSGKHDWSRTCFVQDDNILHHLTALVEWSELVDLMGLKTDVWVVREFLDLDIAFHLPGYHGMPLAREFRGFVSSGDVNCIHPYWPLKAVEQGRPEDKEWSRKLLVDHWDLLPYHQEVTSLLRRVAEVFKDDEPFSVDVCRTKKGRWLVTDMALAKMSYHWENCPNLK